MHEKTINKVYGWLEYENKILGGDKVEKFKKVGHVIYMIFPKGTKGSY